MNNFPVILAALPIVFDESEYSKELGIYQKWIHGSKEQKINKLYSMSAFQAYYPKTGFVTASYQKYAEYLLITVKSIILLNTGDADKDWYVRVYIDESVINIDNPDILIWKHILDYLITQPYVQLIIVRMPRYISHEGTQHHKELLPVIFRYLALFDPNTSIILFRDIDNIYTDQHNYFVQAWLKTNTNIHLFMNDNYKRQQIASITETGLVLEDKFYTTILSGLLSVRKPPGLSSFSVSIWQKMFAYIEESNICTSGEDKVNYVNEMNVGL